MDPDRLLRLSKYFCPLLKAQKNIRTLREKENIQKRENDAPKATGASLKKPTAHL
jgi:hypothetical protein